MPIVKKAGNLCARDAESVTRDIPDDVTPGTRCQETGRGGGASGRVLCDGGDGGGARGMLGRESDVVVVPGCDDDDLSSGLLKDDVRNVSVSVSGRQRSDTLRKGVSGGAERAEEVGGGADGSVKNVADHMPRGEHMISRNLQAEKVFQTRRRSSNVLQSRILLFENLQQGENVADYSTIGGLKTHVGRGSRMWNSDAGFDKV